MRSSLSNFLTIKIDTAYKEMLALIYSLSNILLIYTLTTVAYSYDIS